MESINELRRNGYRLQTQQRIMSDDIVSGWDELGCLLLGHDLGTWWTGTVLDIAEARRLVPGQSATTLQVAAAVLSAVCWMIRNPRRGVLLPDYLPHTEILEVAQPYLGKVVSEQLDWRPERSGGSTGRTGPRSACQFAEYFLEGQPTRPLPHLDGDASYVDRMLADGHSSEARQRAPIRAD
jgi:hypothetical protein